MTLSPNLLSALNYQEIGTFSPIPIYIYLFISLVIISIKIIKASYFSNLFSTMSTEKNQFDKSSTSISSGELNGFIQLSFVLLFSVGVWITKKSYLELSPFLPIIFSFTLLYITQTAGFYLFTFIVGDKDKTFFQHRLKHNELMVVFLFPLLFLVTYLPINLQWLIPLILLVVLLFSWLRSSIYLTQYISSLHIILYLCTLELIPVLFFIKFVLTN